jgi:hypothetical protein
MAAREEWQDGAGDDGVAGERLDVLLVELLDEPVELRAHGE